MARWLQAHPLGGRVLLIEDDLWDLEAALVGHGASVARWQRRATGRSAASPWPPAGPFDAAVVRMPPARAALEMTLHAAASRLAEGGTLYLYGANLEGIRSAGSRLERVMGAAAETLETRRHCRIWSSRLRLGVEPLRSCLRDWRGSVTLSFPYGEETLVSYPGVFSHGRLDPGSRLLIDSLSRVELRGPALDFGCGSGALARALRRLRPELALDLVDNDALAITAAAENLPGARVVCGSGLSALGSRARYGLILSNPPLHRGVARDSSVLLELCRDAPTRLRAGGSLVLVTRRTEPLRRILAAHFESVEVLGQDTRYRVWRAAT